MPRKTIEQLEHEAAHKDREIERLSKDNADLQAGMKASDDLTKALERRIKQMEPADGVDRSEGLVGLAAHVWSLPEGRVTLLACALFLRLWLYAWHDHFWQYNVVFCFAFIPLFCKWNEGEYRQKGFVQLLMKWLLFACGLYATFVTFFGDMAVTDERNLVSAGLVLLIFDLLTISKLTQRLADRIAELFHRLLQVPAIAWAKGWLS